AAAAAGRPLVGVCGGYQMLGRTLRDPLGVESAAGEVSGLGLLPVSTTFEPTKTTMRVSARVAAGRGVLRRPGGVELTAYDIPVGRTESTGGDPAFTVARRNGVATEHADGAVDAQGNVLGTYLHGLFASDGLRRALLTELAALKGLAPDPGWGCPPS